MGEEKYMREFDVTFEFIGTISHKENVDDFRELLWQSDTGEAQNVTLKVDADALEAYVEGRQRIHVVARNEEEAIKLAEAAFNDLDFGDVTDIQIVNQECVASKDKPQTKECTAGEAWLKGQVAPYLNQFGFFAATPVKESDKFSAQRLEETFSEFKERCGADLALYGYCHLDFKETFERENTRFADNTLLPIAARSAANAIRDQLRKETYDVQKSVVDYLHESNLSLNDDYDLIMSGKANGFGIDWNAYLDKEYKISSLDGNSLTVNVVRGGKAVFEALDRAAKSGNEHEEIKICEVEHKQRNKEIKKSAKGEER